MMSPSTAMYRAAPAWVPDGRSVSRVDRVQSTVTAPPHGPREDLLNFLFDGGALSSSDIKGPRLVDSELRAFEFCDEGQAKERLRPYVWRANAALEALETGRARYLQDGSG